MDGSLFILLLYRVVAYGRTTCSADEKYLNEA